jgi:hypothetical protein
VFRSKIVLMLIALALVCGGVALGASADRYVKVRQGDWVVTPEVIGYRCSVDNVAGMWCFGRKKSDYTVFIYKKGVGILGPKSNGKPIIVCQNGKRCEK